MVGNVRNELAGDKADDDGVSLPAGSGLVRLRGAESSVVVLRSAARNHWPTMQPQVGSLPKCGKLLGQSASGAGYTLVWNPCTAATHRPGRYLTTSMRTRARCSSR